MNKTYIGKVIGTFGIKGELKIYSESDFIEERFKKGNKVYFKAGRQEIEVTVSSYKIHKNNILITINNLNNINDVEKYVGYEVYSDQDITLEEDEFLVDDLIGLTVYNEQKELIGEVLDVISIPSNDILEIKTKEKKILIPFINDYIVEITDEYIIIKELEIV